MSIISSIWHHISVGVSAALIVALHFVAPVSTNQMAVQNSSNSQTSSVSISSTTSSTVAPNNFNPTSIGAIPVSHPAPSPAPSETVPTPTVAKSQAVDPNIKIEQCKTIEAYNLSDFTNSENQTFSQQVVALQQTINDKKIAYLASLSSSVPTEDQMKASGVTSINSELEITTAALQSSTQIMQIANQGFQYEYDQDYANLSAQYQQAIADYTQSLRAQYLQCLSQ